jgi:hypothetical protein
MTEMEVAVEFIVSDETFEEDTMESAGPSTEGEEGAADILS